MPAQPRIVSLLPSATEMVCALGLSDQLVGVTHECDYPLPVRDKPVVVRPALPVHTMTQREIDEAASARIRAGLSLYELDAARLQALAPDLIITQSLCSVCAPAEAEVTALLAELPHRPEVLWMTPKSLDGIFENIRELGAATGRLREAEALIADGRARLQRVAESTAQAERLRVFCMEWLDPVYCSGHWMAEMVRIAGGTDTLSRDGADSVRVGWSEVLAWRPEVLVIAPCGMDLAQAAKLAPELGERPGWSELPAARGGRVYAVDANSYFARPGPRVVEGTELLAHLIHPELFAWNGRADAFAPVRIPQAVTA